MPNSFLGTAMAKISGITKLNMVFNNGKMGSMKASKSLMQEFPMGSAEQYSIKLDTYMKACTLEAGSDTVD